MPRQNLFPRYGVTFGVAKQSLPSTKHTRLPSPQQHKIMKKVLFPVWLALGLSIAFAFFNEASCQEDKSSSRKKGALIGAAAGAGTGVIVSRKKVKGALVGGAVGAGAGYLIGRHKDKKKGRLRKD